MTTKTLISSIIGIFVLFTVAYFIFSPIARRALDVPFQEESPQAEPLKPEEPIVPPKPASSPTVATTPTPAPTPANNPAPAPTTPTNPVTVTPGYTAAEVALHSSASSCWSIVDGQVYDLTSYISRHPGGSSRILRICGKDGSSEFDDQHGGSSRPEQILAGYKIGPLK